MKPFLIFVLILGSFLIFACSGKDDPEPQDEPSSSSSEFSGSVDVSSSSSARSSSSNELPSSSSARSSNSTEASSSARSSSSDTGTTTSSSSSATAPVQATDCKTPLIDYPTSTVPADPYTACFKYTDDKCYVCKISSEGEFEGQVNTCSSGWVWDGSQIANNLTSGYWYQEVPCPAGSNPSSSSVRSSSSITGSSSSSARSSSSITGSSSSSVRNSSSSAAVADAKENFHIYLAFGQSNMEGQNWNGNSVAYNDVLPTQYKQNVDPRFQVMTAVGGSYKLASGNEQRTQGNWYTAVPPLIRNNLGLSPADYFGRTLVAGTTNIKVGIIAVAVGGAAIEGFEKGNGANSYFSSQPDWMKQYAANYNNNPYDRLITLAKKAQEVGVIKGIIMHQGESGAASGNWAQKVQGIYNNILSDLGLPSNSIPFLAGQAYGSGNNNSTINGLCNNWTANIANSSSKVCHVISSSGCGHGGDNLHFSYEGYKTLGERYGQKMLELLY